MFNRKSVKSILASLVLVGSLSLVGCDKETQENLEEIQNIELESSADYLDVVPMEELIPTDNEEEHDHVEGNDTVKSKSTDKEETGQCYDCGEFKPVSKMTFNGRSYHCGCEPCDNCQLRFDSKDMNNVPGGKLCDDCYEIYQLEMSEDCDHCGGYDHETENCHTMEVPSCTYCGGYDHDINNCEAKAYDESLGQSWICDICGEENVGEVLCGGCGN